MAKVKVGKGRSTINNYHDSIEIIIPSKKNWFIIVFLGLWLLGWIFGIIVGLSFIFIAPSSEGKFFSIVWLFFWSMGGALAMLIWLYILRGKEMVLIDPNELKYTRDFVLYKRVQEYSFNDIKSLRVDTTHRSFYDFFIGLEIVGLSGGMIAFDYGLNTYRFGSKLDDAEAKYIVDKILEKFPALA